MTIFADVVVDLQYGDCGKGKISHYLCQKREYSHVLRYNGGGNAGHTIFHQGKKFVTHIIPAGVFWSVASVIGPGCVVNPQQFIEEINMLKMGGVDVRGIKIARNAHVVLPEYVVEDGKDTSIGTTKTGNGQTYSHKYARTGIRAESLPELSPYLVDWYFELHETPGDKRLLCEGAQGFGLDIDWGDYPFVTSSHCTVGGAIINGVPHTAIREVWGVAKVYETYVGKKQFEPDDPVFPRIRELGGEFGATTGRPRQCNWINTSLLTKAIRLNAVSHIVFNKIDILREVDVWRLIHDDVVINFSNEKEFTDWLTNYLFKIGISKSNIYFSDNPETLESIGSGQGRLALQHSPKG